MIRLLRTGAWRAQATLVLMLLALGGVVWAGPSQAHQRPDVSAALLRTDDLPAGWTAVDLSDLGGEGFGLGNLPALDLDDLDLDRSGPCAAALAPILDAIVAQPPALGVALFQGSESGPFLGHVVVVPPPGLIETLAGIAAGPGAGGIVDACQQELMPEGAGGFVMDLGLSVETRPLKFPQIGDLSIAQRTDVTLAGFGISLLSVASVRGEALSLLLLLADPVTATESTGLVEQLARLADARLTAALAGR